MDVVVRTAHGEAELSVGTPGRGATLGDLVHHATGSVPPQLCTVDGRPRSTDTLLIDVGLLTGSVISTQDEPAEVPPDAVVELVQVAGRGAGCRVWLPPGRYLVGPGQRVNAADLGLAPVADGRFELDVDAAGVARAAGRSAGVRLDGAVLIEGAGSDAWERGILETANRAFRLSRSKPGAGRERRSSSSGAATVPFNRPPRPPVEPPVPPPPLPDLGRSRRSDRAAVEAYTAALVAARDAERQRRRLAHPDPPTVADLARSADPSLWQRRPDDPDAFRFAVGLADQEWLQVDPTPLPLTLRPVVDRCRTVAAVPVVVDLADHLGIGIVGAPGLGRSVTRSLLLEAAVTHGPADLGIAVLTNHDRAASWEWAKWLPHTRSDAAPPAILCTHLDVEDWVRSQVHHSTPADTGGRLTIVAIDEPAWWTDRDAPLRPLFSSPVPGLRFVVVTESAADVPAPCATVVTARVDGSMTVDYVSEGRRVEHGLAFHTAAAVAADTARRLAPLDDPERRRDPGPALPATVGLAELAGPAEPTAFMQRWADAGDGAPMVLGVAEHGPVLADLVADGPHLALVAATGSQLDDLLRSTVATLAAGRSPRDLVLVLVADDPARFGACTRVPHTVSVVSAPDRHGVERVLRSLRAELRRRASAGAIPRLVVAVADVADVVERAPGAIEGLADVAVRGPQWGVHLILGTTRAAEVEALIAVAGVRVVTRQRDDADSLAALGTTDAARLPRYPAGRAVVHRGGDLTTVQTPTVTGEVPALTAGLTLRPFVVTREWSAMETRIARAAERAAAEAGDAATELGRLVTAIDDAAAALGPMEYAVPVHDRLPPTVALRTLLDEHPGDAVPFALADLPDAQRQEVAWWRPGEDGHLLVYGAPGSGATSLLVALALGVAERSAPDDVHLYVLDADPDRNGPGLAPLAALPHCGAMITIDESRRVVELLELLDAEIERRARSPGGDPVIVLMVDDLAEFRRAAHTRRELHRTWERIEDILRHGPRSGVVAVLTTSDARVVAGLVDTVQRRLVMRLEASGRSTADHLVDADLGIDPSRVVTFGHGRALRLEDHTELQVARPPLDVGAAVADLGLEPAIERPVRRVE
jgi:DNA segregation ATPase FtsK/SpoIIIE, S-DNA-T family